MLTILTFLFNIVVNFALGLGVAFFLGPDEFGTYALVQAAATVIQCLLFEWLRLSANRFFGHAQAEANPDIFTTLTFATAMASIGLSGLALIAYFVAPHFGVSATVGALAPLLAVAGGMFDFRAALARAEFRQKIYALLVITRNALSLLLTLGAAFFWHRADLVLLGLTLSFLCTLLFCHEILSDASRPKAKVSRDLLRSYAHFGLPLISSSLLYLLNVFMVRSFVVMQFSLGESGKLSLALDIGLKIVQGIGSALDVYLFQLAVKADADGGAKAGGDQLARNILIIAGVLWPACAGLLLVLPSFEALFVAPAYRGTFARYLTLLMPGFLAMGAIHYMINPIFQIAHRTRPVVIAAALNLLTTLGLLYFWPGKDGGQGAVAISAGFIVGAVAMLVLVRGVADLRMHWWELGKILLAIPVMALCVWPTTQLQPGPLALILGMLLGGAGYAMMVMVLNVDGLRGYVMTRLRRR